MFGSSLVWFRDLPAVFRGTRDFWIWGVKHMEVLGGYWEYWEGTRDLLGGVLVLVPAPTREMDWGSAGLGPRACQ